jgi:hypothetical protein
MMADHWMIAAGALVTLAAGDAADPNSMAAYGPWAVAFVLVLWAFKDVVLKAMGKESAPPKPQDKEAEVLRIRLLPIYLLPARE